MTPKEKAEEIWLYWNQWPNMNQEDIKAASLFVVNEIINEWKTFPDKKAKNKYWKEVKEEIEKQ